MALESLEHFAAINAEFKKIATQMSVLKVQFSREQKTSIEDGLIDALSMQAQGMLAMAAELKSVAPPPPVEYDPMTGFPIHNGYPQNPETDLYHDPNTGEVLDPQPDLP